MRRVVITGMGCVNPLGNDINTLWDNLLKGTCAIDKISIVNPEMTIKVAAEVRNFDPIALGLDKTAVRRNDRYAQFALIAAKQAMEDSGLQVEKDVAPERFGCAIGSGIGGIHTFVKEQTNILSEGVRRVSPMFIPMMIGNIASAQVAIVYNCQGPNLPVVTACATGTHSVGEAFRMIKDGSADAMITGGTEAAITEIAVGGFANMKALSTSDDPMAASIPFDARRHGFVMGEGAGVLVLEEYEMAKKRGAHIYAEVVGYGNTCDAHHYTAPRPDGKCAAQALRLALQGANYQGENLYINAHGTSTPLNDKSETSAIKQALGEEAARRAVISSTKSMMGHMLGAAGAVELVVSALTLKHGAVAPTINYREPDPDCDLNYTPNTAVDFNAEVAISNSFGFGGQNACVALRKL
ncbi:MAG: beta-ketoacyl-ACP synthase II [Bacteroidales bacterium]|nr:beta-ketoacyl-ACP synthase II [Candidatus Colimorpha merdihippi]MCQ2282994.1 beta-ketoacyl-ACP synthase II [Bacteroidales bacterium]